MAGTPETGALMDSIYEHQRHIYDLSRKYYLLGRDLLIDRLSPPEGGTVLELGCGTGRNLIAAARHYPEARFFGLDVSSVMLKTAAGQVGQRQLSDRISLAEGDATSFDPKALFGVERFDRVFFSYSLSMMPPWRQAMEEGAAHLLPGGRLSLVDFGQQERLPGIFRSLLFWWLRQFHVTPRSDMETTLQSLAVGLGAKAEIQSLRRGYSIYGELTLPA